MQREIERILPSELFDDIVVCCDNPEAKDILNMYKDPRLRFHKRKKAESFEERLGALFLCGFRVFHNPNDF